MRWAREIYSGFSNADSFVSGVLQKRCQALADNNNEQQQRKRILKNAKNTTEFYRAVFLVLHLNHIAVILENSLSQRSVHAIKMLFFLQKKLYLESRLCHAIQFMRFFFRLDFVGFSDSFCPFYLKRRSEKSAFDNSDMTRHRNCFSMSKNFCDIHLVLCIFCNWMTRTVVTEIQTTHSPYSWGFV